MSLHDRIAEKLHASLWNQPVHKTLIIALPSTAQRALSFSTSV
jgi:hypothetical protein